MPIRTIATLAVAIMLGLFAVVLVRNYVAKQTPAQQAQAAGSVPVVVATREIKRGETLQAAVLKVAQVPKDAAPTGAFTTIQQLAGGEGQQRVALRTIAPNEALLPTKVSGPGGRAIMSATVAEGMRAISLRSSEVAGVAGFVLPGDHVDILLTRTVPDGGATLTQTLADNVLILAVDQTDSDEADKPQVSRAVTVQVTPAQAHSITLAQTVGQVSLALRSISDQGLPMKRATTVADLGYAVRKPKPAAALPPAQFAGKPGVPAPPMGETVRVTRGTDTTGYTLTAIK